MTALHHALAKSDVDQRVRRLRWQEQGLVFELKSTDPAVLSLARSVLSAGDESFSDPHLSFDADTEESAESALVRIEAEALDFIVANTGDSIAVHAALLAKNGRGVVVTGPSFAGKSTLAVAMWRAGWSLLADDVILLDAKNRTASPAPRRVSLRSESRGLVGDDLWTEIQRTPSCIHTAKGLFFHPHEVAASERVRVTDVSGIFFLARRGVSVGAARAVSINPAKAAVALLPYAFTLRDLPFMEGLVRIAPLAGSIPSWDLGRGDLAEMIETVERHVG
jgi:hypothetical protein